MNTTWSKPDSVSSVNITPDAPRSLRTIRCTPADSATSRVGEALVHAIGDGAIVVEAGEYLLYRMKNIVQAIDIKKCFLLSGERGVGQVLGRRRRAHRPGTRPDRRASSVA